MNDSAEYDRAEYVLGLTEHERIAALVRFAGMYPDLFDEVVRQDTERQRAIRASRARLARRRGTEDSSEEGQGG